MRASSRTQISPLSSAKPPAAAASSVARHCSPIASAAGGYANEDMAQRYGKPYGFILNHAPPSWEITKAAIAHLKKLGGTVITQPIQFRQSYMTSISVGKTAPEVEKDGQASKDVDLIWKELKAAIKATVK